MSKKNQVLPSGLEVEKGTLIGWAPWVLGRNERIWGDDYMEIKLERWLNGEFVTAFQFPVFNAGKRTCMGKSMALVEAKLLLAMMLSRLHPILPVGQDIAYHPNSLTLWMINPLMMRFEELD